MEQPIWMYVLSMGGYLVFLYFMIELLRKNVKLSMWFFVLSLLTIPLWLISGGVDGWFRWAKNLSVILPLIVVGLVRISHYEQRPGKMWELLRKDEALWFFYGILFLNIAEATLKDVALGNYANALCGLLLCVTIPYAPKYWNFSGGKMELISYTTFAWNFLYTTWNMCFVYGEGATFFASSVCILLAAELYPIIKGRPELYITARIYTLGIHLIIRSCFPALFPSVMNSSAWFNESVLVGWGFVNMVLILPYVFWHMWQLHTGNAAYSFKRKKQPEKGQVVHMA